MKIKVSEIFYSLQGEGRHVGTPSVFLRTFGCNFTCDGFGSHLPDFVGINTRKEVDPSLYKTYEELPLVRKGCDSYASWDPRFKDLSKFYTLEELSEKCLSLIPNRMFDHQTHLIITGGEPLLGWQKGFVELLKILKPMHITFETNGTQVLSSALVTSLIENVKYVTFSVSAKLPSSGEKFETAINPKAVESYKFYHAKTGGYPDIYLKFVVGTKTDIEDVKRAIARYAEQDVYFGGQDVYLMPVGGTVESYLNEREVADLALHNGYRFSPRLQVGLYKNAWGT